MFSYNTDSLGYQSFKGASWALISGLHFGDTVKGLSLVLGSLFNPDVWACVLGLRAYYFKPHQLYKKYLPYKYYLFIKDTILSRYIVILFYYIVTKIMIKNTKI